MADLANEGRGGAVGGQLAARERAGEGSGVTGPRGQHLGVRGAPLLWDSGTVSPAAARYCVPSAELTGPAHHSQQPRPCRRPTRGLERPLGP